MKIPLIPALACCLTLYFLQSCQVNYEPGSYSCTNLDPSQDSAALLKFAADNGISPVRDSSGLYYEIIKQGTGQTPTYSSRVYVTYTAKLMDGTLFDSTGSSSTKDFLLSLAIKGWQIGLPKIQTNGHIKLLIPSGLGYGCAGGMSGRIPKNAPLYYDVILVSVQ
ncbi:MAG: FKBP-type peptidyl-prolyl cis-trans isomerase [Chitinophagales bacterium]